MKAITLVGALFVLLLSALANASEVKIYCSGSGYGETKNRIMSGFQVSVFPKTRKLEVYIPKEAYFPRGEGLLAEKCDYKMAPDPTIPTMREPLRSTGCKLLDTTISFEYEIEKILSAIQRDASAIKKLKDIKGTFVAYFHCFNNLDDYEPIPDASATLTCQVVKF